MKSSCYILLALALAPFVPVATHAATLVGHWALNETSGTTAADSSGNSNTGTLSNGPTWTAGQIGNALAFDGVNDIVNCGSGASLDNLPGISVAAWIRPTNMGEGTFGRIVHKGAVNNPTGSNGGFRVYLTGTNQLQFDVDYATTDLARRTSTNAITLNTWQHVAIAWSGSTTATTARIYVNGVETTYATTTNGAGTRSTDAAASLYIGNSSTLDRTFNGTIDDVRVYNGALTATEVQALYQAGMLPAPPSDLVASAVSTSQIDLSWTINSTNETGFEIDRALDSGFTTGLVVNAYTAAANVNTVAATGLSASTTYYFRVRATNSTGDSANSNTASATTHLAVDSSYAGYTSAPLDDGVNAGDNETNSWASSESSTAPHWIEVAFGQATNLNYAELYWAFNNSQQKYMTSQQVQVQAWDGTAYQTVATMTYSGDVANTLITFPQVSTTRLRFYQPANQGHPNYSVVMWVSEVNYGLIAPSAPSGLTASAVSSSQVDLAWVDNSGNETGFEIDRALDSAFTTGLVLVAYTAPADATSVAATGLSASTTYYFRVRAVNATGDSLNSNTASATTLGAGSPPAAPSNLVASAVSSSQIDLTWTDASNNETGFEVDRALDSGFTTGLVVNAYTTAMNTNSVAATGLSASTTYYFRVRATNATADSANSNTANATTTAAGNWQLAAGHWVDSPFTLPTGGVDTSSKMRIVHPRPDAETSPYAFCRNAYPGIPYRIPISVVGGAWPLKYELVSGPSGMSVGETYGSTDYGILSWSNPVTSGSPHSVTVRVTDQAGNTQDRTWTVDVNTANFIFVQDGYSGTKTGSITQPFENFVDFNGNAAYANKLCIVRSGNYSLVLNQGVYMGTTAPLVIMGHNGEAKPVITCTNAVFQPDKSDTFVAGLLFQDSRPDIADSKFIAFNKLTHRCGVFEADFRNQVIGTAGTDNPCSIWVNGQGTNYRDYFLVSHCTTDNFAASLCTLYHVRYAVVERNTVSNNKPTMAINSRFAMKVKSDSIYVSVRANVGEVGLNPPDGVIEITNQEQGLPMDHIEVCWNKIKCVSAANTAFRFWGDANPPYRDRYSYRNTYYGQVKVLSLARLRCTFTNDIAVNDITPQIPASSTASIVTKIDTLERPTSNNPLDAAGNLTGADRTTYLGIRGAEVD